MKMGLGQATPQIFRFHPNLTPYGAVRSSDNEHNRQNWEVPVLLYLNTSFVAKRCYHLGNEFRKERA